MIPKKLAPDLIRGESRFSEKIMRKKASPMRYELYYWPSIQGRGEFIRLALEEAGADYIDVARRSGKRGVPAMMKLMNDSGSRIRPTRRRFSRPARSSSPRRPIFYYFSVRDCGSHRATRPAGYGRTNCS
jgi:hypothetical protein